MTASSEEGGVGEVEVPVDVHDPVVGHRAEVDVEVAGLQRLESVGLGLGGVEPDGGLLDNPLDLRPGAGPQYGDEVGVDERGTFGWEGRGEVGDLAGLPHRHPPRHDGVPELREPPAALHGVPDQRPPGVSGAADREGELRDAFLVHGGGAVPGDLQGPHPERDAEVDLVAGVRGRPLTREAEQVDLQGDQAGVDLLDRTQQHPGRGRCGGSAGDHVSAYVEQVCESIPDAGSVDESGGMFSVVTTAG